MLVALMSGDAFMFDLGLDGVITEMQ